jgi:hypothetical protein
VSGDASLRAVRTPLSRLEWAALALAALIAHGFFAHGVIYASGYDAVQYREIADDMLKVGPFAKYHYSQLRTYAYPLVLAALKPVAVGLHVPWTLVIFEFQLAAYLGAAAALRGRVAQVSPRTARIVFVALIVNPIALLYASEPLTESLSVTLIIVAAACAAHLIVGRQRMGVAVAIGAFAIGLAVMVRPANLFAVPAAIVAVVAAAGLRGWPLRKQVTALALAAMLGALPVLPQLANNVRHYQHWTPFVTFDLGKFQLYWGVRSLKYATAMPPIEYPSVYYENPLVAGRPVDIERPLDWYRRYPLQAAATMTIHVLAMLDQDLLFTYARDLDPWYRRPLGVLTHGAIALALLGLLALVSLARTERTARAVAAPLVVLVLGHLALHATTAVEMRFALPLLVIAGPLAAWYASTVWPAMRRRRRALAAGFVLAWIAGSLALSEWVRSQAPQIRAWQAGVPFVPPK